MLSILSVILISVAIIHILAKRRWHRLLCAFAIIVPAVFHYAVFSDLYGFEFYGTAMAANAIAISLLEFLKVKNQPPSPLLVDLQIISLIAMAVNFIGYAIWFSYFSPVWYDSLIIVLSVAESLRLILHTKSDKAYGVYHSNNLRLLNATRRDLGSFE